MSTFNELYDQLRNVNEQVTVPIKPMTPTEPYTPEPTTPAEPKKRPKSPIVPAPGIHPKPKASKNKDVDLFKEARSSIKEMAFDPGKFPSFIHPEKKRWIETGDEELDAILPKLTEGEQSYLEMITSKSYQDMIGRLEKYTNTEAENIDLPQLFSTVLQSLQKAIEIEKGSKKTLEDLALKTVLELDEFEMIKEAYEGGSVRFDIQLGQAELDPTKIDMKAEEGELSEAEEINLELATELEKLGERQLQRRLANLLIQGSAVLKLYLFNLVNEELVKIDESLPKCYGLLAVFAQLGYWIAPPGIEQMVANSSEGAAGSEEVIPEGEGYIIKVRGVTFPYLIHELTKGIYEWISLNPELKTAMKSDSLEKETEDIIVGSELFKIITSYIPAGKQKYIPLVHKKLLELSREQIKQVLAKSAKGKSIIVNLVRESEREWDEYQEEKREGESD